MSLRSRFLRFLREERGQVLPFFAVVAVGLMGIAGMVIDVGHVYISYNELLASTNAAALAGAQALPNSTAITIAKQYSGVAGNLNAQANLPGVTMAPGYPKLYCYSAIQSAQPCVTSSGGTDGGNVMLVKQQVAVNMFFASLFGFRTINLTATAAASMRGGNIPPYNVAIIVDGTGSMGDKDSNCPGVQNATRMSCALAGVRMLLNELYPCASSDSSCISGTVHPVDNVALFQFPNVTPSTVTYESNCSGSKPTPAGYTFPSTTATAYTPDAAPNTSTPTYQVVGFSNDYRASDTATSLYTSSSLVKAAGAGGSSCSSMTNPGGEGTYLAGVMYAAQAALIAEKQAPGNNPNAQNVIILLTDGAATATNTTGRNAKTEMPGASSTSGTYPSIINECQQTIDAATSAKNNGIRVYTVAYGADTSGCTTDTQPKVGNGAETSPCDELAKSASSPLTFFSDYTGGGGCLSSARPATDLNTIFAQIGGDFSTSRLIPISSLPAGT